MASPSTSFRAHRHRGCYPSSPGFGFSDTTLGLKEVPHGMGTRNVGAADRHRWDGLDDGAVHLE